MKSVQSIVMLVVAPALVVLLSSVSHSEAASCLEKMEFTSKFMEAQKACIAGLKLNATDVPDVSELKQKHFNDKCVSNCTLESLNLYNNGTLLKDKILSTLKNQATSEVYNKLAVAVEACIEKANKKHEKKEKKDGKKKMNKMTKEVPVKKPHGMCNCKRAAKFIHCMTEEDNKLC